MIQNSSASFAILPEDAQRMENLLVEAIQRDPELKNEAAAVGLAVAEIYMQNHAYQEAIWALDRSGHYAAAEKLAGDYEAFLKTAKIVSVEDAGRGITVPVLVEFENGQRAILKHPDSVEPNSYRNEVETYRFDRRVGFNLTPAAVTRNIGGVDYVLVGFIEGARNSEINLETYANPKYPDIYLLDYLIAHWDRHENNSMISKGGRLFGVDNGRIGKPEARPQFDEHIHPSAQLLKNLLLLPLNNEFYTWLHSLGPSLSFIGDRIQAVKSVFATTSPRGKVRPSTTQGRLAVPESDGHINASLRALVEDFKNDILKRAKLLPPTPTTREGALPVTMETLEVYLMRPKALDNLTLKRDPAKLAKLYHLAKSQPALMLKLFTNLLDQPENLGEALRHQIGDLLSHEMAIFPEVFVYPLHAVELIPSSEALRATFLRYLDMLGNDTYAKSDLVTKYVEVELAHAKDATTTVSELLDLLEHTGLQRMVRKIPQTLKVGPATSERLWAMYAKGSTRGYFPLGTLDEFIRSQSLTRAQEITFVNRLTYISESSTVFDALKWIEQSPNRSRLFQLFKGLFKQATDDAFAVGYLRYVYSKNIPALTATEIFKTIAEQVPRDVLPAVIRSFEDRYATESWKPVLQVLLTKDPSQVSKKLEVYKRQNTRFKIDEAIFSMPPNTLLHYLNNSGQSSKSHTCESFLNP